MHPAGQGRPARGFFHALQAAEKLAAGDEYDNSGYVLVDELGRPFKTDKLRRETHKLMAMAGVRKVRLYDARHACLSWMANNGVPRHGGLGVGGSQRPVVHQADLRAPGGEEPAGGR